MVDHSHRTTSSSDSHARERLTSTWFPVILNGLLPSITCSKSGLTIFSTSCYKCTVRKYIHLYKCASTYVTGYCRELQSQHHIKKECALYSGTSQLRILWNLNLCLYTAFLMQSSSNTLRTPGPQVGLYQGEFQNSEVASTRCGRQ